MAVVRPGDHRGAVVAGKLADKNGSTGHGISPCFQSLQEQAVFPMERAASASGAVTDTYYIPFLLCGQVGIEMRQNAQKFGRIKEIV
jgi:hypothetical protein